MRSSFILPSHSHKKIIFKTHSFALPCLQGISSQTLFPVGKGNKNCLQTRILHKLKAMSKGNWEDMELKSSVAAVQLSRRTGYQVPPALKAAHRKKALLQHASEKIWTGQLERRPKPKMAKWHSDEAYKGKRASSIWTGVSIRRKTECLFLIIWI